MNNDISEEAKTALALNSHRKARERLRRDGAEATAAMQRRVKALATERSIPPADYAKLFHKRVLTQPVLDFCKKHKVSVDWLLCCDLKGLRRMTQAARAEPPEISEAHREEIMRLSSALTLQKQLIGFALLRELMARSIPNG